MAYLREFPKELTELVFEPGGLARPGGSSYMRFLCHLLAWPGADSRGWISRLLRSELRLPKTTTFYPGFKCIVGNIICGENVGLCDTFFIDYVPVYLGDYVGFSYRNMVITSTHDLSNFNRVICRPVVIENNAWITSNVTILAGVRIGENSVIGAGSVVSNDIPPNVFASGNPCKPVKAIRRGY